MHDDMRYLRDRVDGIADVLVRNTVILEKNTESLAEHMRRTAALEKQMDTALIPIKAVKWFGVFITLLGTAVGAILSFKQLF